MIHDLDIQPLDVNPTATGELVELYRDDWDLFDPAADAADADTTADAEEDEATAAPRMATMETAFPGTVDAWQRHPEGQVDHLTVPRGQIELGVYDDREGSPTRGETASVVLSDRNQILVRVPAGVWHGYQVLGDEPAMILNFPSRLYEYYDPDLETMAADSETIPFDWS
jgi:dTDP-4-dehydrorhamnose 3,5-epimerase